MSEFPNNPEDVGAQMESSLAQRLNDAGVFPSASGGLADETSSQQYKLFCPVGRKILLSPTPDTPESDISTAGDEWDSCAWGPYEEVSFAEAGVDGIHLIPPEIMPRMFDLPGVVLWNSTDRVVWDDEAEGWEDYND